MPNAGPQGPYRKSLAIKHLDGEPLTRRDIQYDVLHYLFSNTEVVFTDPFPTIRGGPAGTKVNFRDLYVNALAHSSKCSKVTKDKLLDTPDFGIEFSKISLLSNVGRINTTMAFFPEMRTALRTYHPVPSLQKTDGNLQDAPRIKNILKSCFAPTERQNPPLTPADVLARSRSGQIPATSIVNMMFVFAGHAAVITQTHFGSQTSHDLLDFFCPVNISSESRAHAILWLCYNYLEAPSANPFADDYARSHPGKIPELTIISEEEAALENVDPSDEKQWGEKMQAERKVFMANKDREAESTGDKAEGSKSRGKVGKGKGRGGKVKAVASGRRKARALALGKDEKTMSSTPNILFEDELPSGGFPFSQSFSSHQVSPGPPIPSSSYISLPVTPPLSQARSLAKHHLEHTSSQLARARSVADPYPSRPRSPLTTSQSAEGGPSRSRQRKARERRPPPTHLSSEGGVSPPSGPNSVPIHPGRNVYVSPSPIRREGLEHAFYMVMNTDPLQDSEGEEEIDENVHHDLLLRLRIINRLRGKEPTPEPDHVPMDLVPFTFTRSH